MTLKILKALCITPSNTLILLKENTTRSVLVQVCSKTCVRFMVSSANGSYLLGLGKNEKAITEAYNVFEFAWIPQLTKWREIFYSCYWCLSIVLGGSIIHTKVLHLCMCMHICKCCIYVSMHIYYISLYIIYSIYYLFYIFYILFMF